MRPVQALRSREGHPLILDLGCGRNPRPGAVGVDRVKLPGVDVVHNLDDFPYPFADSSADHVYLTHVIEHMDSIIRVIEEVHRILRPGGRLTVITPHHSDAISWQDPTHKWHLNSRSFRYFEQDYHTNYYTLARFKTLSRHQELARIWRYLGLQALINLDNSFPSLRFLRAVWEQHLCFIIRGKQITFELEAIK